MKKALLVTTVSGFIPQFEMNSVEILKENGYEVHYASNFNNVFYGKDNSRLDGTGIIRHQIDFSRSPYSVNTITAYKQLDHLLSREHFDVIHCHTPLGGSLARIVGNKHNVDKIVYTVHGFHFYKGAPMLNWLVYYTVEKSMAHYTDALITLNDEDYTRAKKFNLRPHGEAHKLNGVGIDLQKFQNVETDTQKKRREFGIGLDDFVILSVGELNKNKNHATVIRAIADESDNRTKYIICGEGEQIHSLRKLTVELGMEGRVIFPGYRYDIPEIYKCADMFAFPSYREGMPVALMEAMASGLPVVVSNIRGNKDLVENEINGYLVGADDVQAWRACLAKLKNDIVLRGSMMRRNAEKMSLYSKECVKNQLKEIYFRHGIISY